MKRISTIIIALLFASFCLSCEKPGGEEVEQPGIVDSSAVVDPSQSSEDNNTGEQQNTDGQQQDNQGDTQDLSGQQQEGQEDIQNGSEGQQQEGQDDPQNDTGKPDENQVEDSGSSFNFNEDSDYSFLASEAPDKLSAGDVERLSAVNDFAFRLAEAISREKDSESFVISPISLTFLLGMLSEGAAGQSKTEICDVLGFSGNGQESLNEFCRNLMVIASAAAGKDECLEIANAAVLNKDFSLLESYREIIKNYYDAYSCNLDFSHSDAVNVVNSWASKHTHGRIDRILDELSPTARAVFLNALYFKASWAIPFDEYYTKKGNFKTGSGGVRTEQMMKMKSSLDMFSYCENYRYKAVKLAYGYSDKGTSGNYDMTLILPEENTTIQNLLKSADASFWADVQSSMKQEFVDIKLPRFNIDLNINLNDILYELGVKSIFDPKNADFSKISEDLLYISFIKQVANISVDEAGTEAAAVSVAAMEVADAPGEEPAFKVFHADRPFLFAITEQTTGAILFLGCYR